MRLPLITYDKITEKIARFFNCEQIESLARQSGFVQRKSPLSGHSFLLLSMFDHQSHNRSSLNGLCASLLDYGVAVRKQSLDARFKSHSILAGTHPSFPIDFWHELIPQAEITLNMMRAFADQRNISAYYGIHRTPYSLLHVEWFSMEDNHRT